MNNGMFATLGRLADAVWEIVLLLGGILGKTTEEIEHDRNELS